MNLQDFRDWVIVIFGIAGVLAFLVTIIILLVVGLAARGLIGIAKGAIQEGIVPTLRSAREAMEEVRSTTAFVSETAVSPIIRVYSILAAIRRAAAVIFGLSRRGQKGK